MTDSSSPKKISLRRIIELARPELRTLSFGMVFLIIGSGMGLLYPQAIGAIIDGVLTDESGDKINQAAGFMIVVFLVQALAVAMRYYLFTVAGERVVARLRADLFSSILSQEIAFFDTRRTGELTNRLSADTAVLQNTVSVNISMALRNLATVIGGLGLLAFTSPALTLLMLVSVPPVVIGAVFFGRKLRKLSREVQDALARSSEVAEESFSAVRTVRAFSREPFQAERYHARVWDSFELARRRSKIGALFSSVVSFMGYGAITLVLWYGSWQVIDGNMSVGDLTTFILYTLLVAVSLGALSGLWGNFMSALGAAERVFSLLDRDPLIPPTGGEKLTEIKGHIQFTDVHFSYPSRADIEVIKGIDMEIQAGEIIALVGPSGSGKSTIASLLLRFYDPQSGELKIDGKDLRILDPAWLREQIGIVAQEPILFSASIQENIRYGRPEATDEEVAEAAKIANAKEFILTFPEGFDTEVGERGVQLSGGQKQRVAIARAILKNPSILILDEATSALDTESEAIVKEALDRLMKDRTTLIIAHRLSTVQDAHRVMVIEKGALVQSGTHEELLAEEGTYRRLVQKQFQLQAG